MTNGFSWRKNVKKKREKPSFILLSSELYRGLKKYRNYRNRLLYRDLLILAQMWHKAASIDSFSRN